MYLRVVKSQTHNDFVAENNLHSFYVSAKTGDSIHSMFLEIAAELYDMKLDKADLENAKVKAAEEMSTCLLTTCLCRIL
jgi:Ras-related protein Rab-28